MTDNKIYSFEDTIMIIFLPMLIYFIGGIMDGCTFEQYIYSCISGIILGIIIIGVCNYVYIKRKKVLPGE